MNQDAIDKLNIDHGESEYDGNECERDCNPCR